MPPGRDPRALHGVVRSVRRAGLASHLPPETIGFRATLAWGTIGPERWPFRIVLPDHEALETCVNSSSTGVARPKIETDTLSRLFD